MVLPHPEWIEFLLALATPLGMELSLVGGAVRDQMLGHPVALKDLDLVVEGPEPWPALGLAELIVESAAAGELPTGYGLLQCIPHQSYGTVRLRLQINAELLLCDLSSARSETYNFPGDHPLVQPANLWIDLHRRDFSLNAMALRLPNQELIDPFGGVADLAARQLQFLHSGSLRDDPTRLIRAVRYGARFDLQFAAASWEQTIATLNSWPWPQMAPALGARLRMELELLLGEACWQKALCLLRRWGGLQLLQPGWQQLPKGTTAYLLRLGCWGEILMPTCMAADLRLVGLLDLMPATEMLKLEIAQRLQFAHWQQQLLDQVINLRQWLDQENWQIEWKPSQWTAALEKQHQAMAVLLVLLQPRGKYLPWRRPLLAWLWRWRLQKPLITAEILIGQGYKPGPELGERLKLERAKLIDQAAD